MNAVVSTLEVRELPPLELPRVEVVLPMPRVLFEEINRLGISAVHAISEMVADGSSFINGPSQSDRFPEVWKNILKPFRRKVLRSGETVRASLPMRSGEWKCLQTAAQFAGVTEQELALIILTRRLEFEVKRTREAVGNVPRSHSRRPLPPVTVRPSPVPSETEDNIFTFHKCRACPHRSKPWHSPNHAS